MSKTQDTARAGMLAGVTAGHGQAQVDRRLAVEADQGRAVAMLDVSGVWNRVADSRPARAAHVLALAESIAAIGLVQSIAVDRHRRLVAGRHRLEACRLLLLAPDARLAHLQALEGGDRLDPDETTERLLDLPAPGKLPDPLRSGKVPGRIMVDLDAAADPSGALAVEAAENTARRNYTAPEVEALAGRLRRAGYREAGGRPRAGEKALRPALELVLGVSASTVRRLLGRKDAAGKGGQMAMFSGTLNRLRLGLAAINRLEPPAGERLAALRRALDLSQALAAALPAAVAEVEALEEKEV